MKVAKPIWDPCCYLVTEYGSYFTSLNYHPALFLCVFVVALANKADSELDHKTTDSDHHPYP
jgi:hypothetical protein